MRVDEDRGGCGDLYVYAAFEERSAAQEEARRCLLLLGRPGDRLARWLPSGCGVVGRLCGPANEPRACAGGDEHNQKEQRDPSAAGAASPTPTLNRDEHVERHRPESSAHFGRAPTPRMAAVFTTAELREGFLAFHEEKGHLRRPSASLIPRADDRSTLLISAGMQPQMPFFLGLETPPAPLTTICQKVFRTVDIDTVGLDTYHLTFFEMLGNFSFGQYFKEGAISYATEFIQERLKLDWDRVWVSVHAGDPGSSSAPTRRRSAFGSRSACRRNGSCRCRRPRTSGRSAARDRAVPIPRCTGTGARTGCGTDDCLPGCTRCERFLEFGNLVFMSYELHPDGTLTDLPSKNIDTGWGLERVARVVQDVASVYDTDGYQLIMDWVAEQSGVAYGSSEDATKAHRVLADHGRAMTFIAAEGVRRRTRGAVTSSGASCAERCSTGFGSGWRGRSSRVCRRRDRADGARLPRARRASRRPARVLAAEEERFGETLERGMTKFEEAAAKARSRATTRSSCRRPTASRSS